MINIITKKANDGLHGSAMVAAGLHKNRQAASFSYGHEGWSLLGSFSRKEVSKVRLSNDFKPTSMVINGVNSNQPVVTEDGGYRENSHWLSNNAWLRGGFSNDRTSLFASVFVLDSERGRPWNTMENRVKGNFSTFADIPVYRDTGIDVNFKHDFNDFVTLRSNLYHHDHKDNYRSYGWNETLGAPDKNMVLGLSEYKDFNSGIGSIVDLNFSKQHRLSFSANYKYDSHQEQGDQDEPFVESHLDTISLGIEDHYQWKKFVLVSGLAWHREKLNKVEDKKIDVGANSTLDPMVGLTYQLDGVDRLYGSIAKKTRFATFSQMKPKKGVASYDLKPEKSLSYTLGYHFSTSVGVPLDNDIALYYHDISDNIAETKNAEGDPVYRNLDEAKIKGIELSTRATITDNISLDVSYTYAKATQFDVIKQVSRPMLDIPKHEVIGMLNWSIPSCSSTATLDVRYRNKMLLNDYKTNYVEKNALTVNMGLTYDVMANAALFMHITNIFDEYHLDGYGQPNEGRNVEIGFNYTF